MPSTKQTASEGAAAIAAAAAAADADAQKMAATKRETRASEEKAWKVFVFVICFVICMWCVGFRQHSTVDLSSASRVELQVELQLRLAWQNVADANAKMNRARGHTSYVSSNRAAADAKDLESRAALQFEKAISKGSTDLRSFAVLGHLWFKAGRKARAILMWEKVIAKRPCAARLIFNLAQAYTMVGDYARAELLFDRVIAMDWGCKDAKVISWENRGQWVAQSHLCLGRIHITDHRWEEALGHLKPLAADNNRGVYHLAQYHIGQIHVTMGKLREAAKAFRACAGSEAVAAATPTYSGNGVQHSGMDLDRRVAALCNVELAAVWEKPRRVRMKNTKVASLAYRHAQRAQRVRKAIHYYSLSLKLRNGWFAHVRIAALREELAMRSLGRRRRVLASDGFAVVDDDGFVRQRKGSAASAVGAATAAATTATGEDLPVEDMSGGGGGGASGLATNGEALRGEHAADAETEIVEVEVDGEGAATREEEDDDSVASFGGDFGDFDDDFDFDDDGSTAAESSSGVGDSGGGARGEQAVAKHAQSKQQQQQQQRCFVSGRSGPTVACDVRAVNIDSAPEKSDAQGKGTRRRAWGWDWRTNGTVSDETNEHMQRQSDQTIVLPYASRVVPEVGHGHPYAKPPPDGYFGIAHIAHYDDAVRRDRVVLGNLGVAAKLIGGLVDVMRTPQCAHLGRDTQKQKNSKKKKKKRHKHRARKLVILELGCEQAVLGELAREQWTTEIGSLRCSNFGAELGAQLIPAKWAKRSLYDEVVDAPLLEALKVEREREQLTDVIMAIDTVPSIARLGEFFYLAALALRVGGLFAFVSVDTPAQYPRVLVDDVSLTGRKGASAAFAWPDGTLLVDTRLALVHSATYIAAEARLNGFTVEHEETLNATLNGWGAVTGRVFIMRLKAARVFDDKKGETIYRQFKDLYHSDSSLVHDDEPTCRG